MPDHHRLACTLSAVATMRTTLDAARWAYINYLRERFGHEAAAQRADGIDAGREHEGEFIAGYLAAVRDGEEF